MNPAFKITQLKAIFPAFVDTTHLFINAIREEIKSGRSALNPFPLLSKVLYYTGEVINIINDWY